MMALIAGIFLFSFSAGIVPRGRRRGGPRFSVRTVAFGVRGGVPANRLDPLRRSPRLLNEPAVPLATPHNLHGPRQRVPDRWLGDEDRRTTEETVTGQQPRANPVGKGTAWTATPVRLGGSAPVSAGDQKTPGGCHPPGVVHQRHTVGLGIPRPVARLQSRTPLPQARGD